MSQNFLRVKKDILEDIKGSSCHTQSSWADILLRHSKYCVTKEDQRSLMNFILNPSDSREFVNPKYVDQEIQNSVDIHRFEKMFISDPNEEKSNSVEIELENEIFTRGNTTFIRTKTVTREECKSEEQKECLEC